MEMETTTNPPTRAEIDWRWEVLNDFGARGEAAPEWFVAETDARTEAFWAAERK